jgi:hypothetical protein
LTNSAYYSIILDRELGTEPFKNLAKESKMKPKTFCWLIFLFVLIFVNGNGWAQITSIDIIPPNPTTDDSITVTVKGLFPNYCHYMLKGSQWLWTDLEGDKNIILELSHWYINFICPQAIKDFSVTFSLGKLPADSYSLHIATIYHQLITDTPQISYSDTLLQFTVTPPTYINGETSPVPGKFELFQNYPNPFNQLTQIGFTLENSAFVDLTIYDLLGRKVKTLVSENLPTGYKSVLWDGTDESGKEVASGIYLYELKAGDLSMSKKLVLLK